jgi:hypothetical protein
MGAGRPPKLSKIGTPEEVQAYIDAWYAEREAKDWPLTYSGLALHLGIDTQTLWSYANPEPSEDALERGYTGGMTREYTAPIKEALGRIADGYERLLYAGKPVGGIFALKQSATRWADKQETTISLDADSWAATLSAAREAKQLKRASKHAPQALPEST